MVDVRVGARRPTYPDGDAVLIVAGRELDDKLGAGLLLGVVERPEPADHLDAVLGGDLSLPRRLHCHCESGGDGDYGGDDDEGACVCARARLCACVPSARSSGIGATDTPHLLLLLLHRHLLVVLGYSPLLPTTLCCDRTWSEATGRHRRRTA